MTNPGKPGIIFDFDDTLVETAVFFETAREKYIRLMEELGFPREEALAVLDLKDIENVRKCGGFLKECFPNAMVMTYRHFCRLYSIAPDPQILEAVEGMGRWVFEQKPVRVEGAQAILEELSRGYEMFLATKGDPSVQWGRIRESSLSRYFKDIYVLKDKTSREYERIAVQQNLSPGGSWIVGNSMKSDINPGILAGFNCILIPNPYTWRFEMEEPAGHYFTLESLCSLPGFLHRKNIAV